MASCQESPPCSGQEEPLQQTVRMCVHCACVSSAWPSLWMEGRPPRIFLQPGNTQRAVNTRQQKAHRHNTVLRTNNKPISPRGGKTSIGMGRAVNKQTNNARQQQRRRASVRPSGMRDVKRIITLLGADEALSFSFFLFLDTEHTCACMNIKAPSLSSFAFGRQL